MSRLRIRLRGGSGGGSALAYLNPVARVLHSSTGVVAQSHTRVPYVNLSTAAITNPEIIYNHFAYNAVLEFAPTSTATVRAGIEYPLGTITPLTTDGTNRDITITGGVNNGIGQALKASGLNIPPGALFWIRTRCIISGGDGNMHRAYSNNAAFNTGTIQSWTGAVDGTDFTTSGTQPTNSGAGYGPAAVCSREVGNKARSFALFGDSIMRGNVVGAKALVEEALVTAGYTYLNLSFSGAKVADGGNTNPVRRKALALAAGCTDGVINYPVNDLTNNTAQATIQTAFTNLWTNLKSGGGLQRLIQLTCTPYTETDINTPMALPTGVFTGGSASRRAIINDWQRSTVVRGTATSFDYLQDLADAFEQSRNSGTWLNTTVVLPAPDLLHPSAAGVDYYNPIFRTFLTASGY